MKTKDFAYIPFWWGRIIGLLPQKPILSLFKVKRYKAKWQALYKLEEQEQDNRSIAKGNISNDSKSQS